MGELLFPLPAPTIPIRGRDALFPVGRVFCVGRNYAAHAREMGADPSREPPFFFMKPARAVTTEGVLPFPPDTDNLHHEVELVVALGPGGEVFGHCVGVDLTKRDRQNEAKAAGQPWERGKAFERSAPVSPITPGAVARGARIALSVNGAPRQESSIDCMIWRVEEILERLRASWSPQAGDLIFTGTPEGVAALKPGDAVRAEIDGLDALAFSLR